MHLFVIINSIVCAIATALAVAVSAGSVISIANMKVPWREWLLYTAFLLPVAFAVSGVGAWLAYRWSTTPVTIGFMVFPWLYTLGFILWMVVSLQQ